MYLWIYITFECFYLSICQFTYRSKCISICLSIFFINQLWIIIYIKRATRISIILQSITVYYFIVIIIRLKVILSCICCGPYKGRWIASCKEQVSSTWKFSWATVQPGCWGEHRPEQWLHHQEVCWAPRRCELPVVDVEGWSLTSCYLVQHFQPVQGFRQWDTPRPLLDRPVHLRRPSGHNFPCEESDGLCRLETAVRLWMSETWPWYGLCQIFHVQTYLRVLKKEIRE